jgi:hypothetical protein
LCAFPLALHADAPAGTYGEAPTLQEVTPIADIVADPAAFEGQEVLVEGTVHGVCAKAGCWMELADADGHEIRIKVDDGVIVFPKEAVGVNAAAQGKVTVHEMDREEFVGWQRHLAEEMGEEFDESSIGDGPYQMVQISGSGARIGS